MGDGGPRSRHLGVARNIGLASDQEVPRDKGTQHYHGLRLDEEAGSETGRHGETLDSPTETYVTCPADPRGRDPYSAHGKVGSSEQKVLTTTVSSPLRVGWVPLGGPPTKVRKPHPSSLSFQSTDGRENGVTQYTVCPGPVGVPSLPVPLRPRYSRREEERGREGEREGSTGKGREERGPGVLTGVTQREPEGRTRKDPTTGKTFDSEGRNPLRDTYR